MVWPIKHHYFESVDSTQDHARALLDSGETLPFLVTASEQTAGRGRLGRTWISPRGNFFGSLGLRPVVPLARYGEYSFLSALVLRDTITQFLTAQILFKWPNDVLLHGRKCAGILIESHGAQNEFMIIGMGVNLRHVPPNDAVQIPAAALWPDAGPDQERDMAFAAAVIKNFTLWHQRYEEEGFETIRTAWLKHAHQPGEKIIVKTPQQNHTGIFTGIDAAGNLLLTQGDQIIKVTAADVYLS